MISCSGQVGDGKPMENEQSDGWTSVQLIVPNLSPRRWRTRVGKMGCMVDGFHIKGFRLVGHKVDTLGVLKTRLLGWNRCGF